MGNKLKKLLCIWIPIIVIGPAILIIAVAWLLQALTPVTNEAVILMLNLNKEMTLQEYLSLYSSFAGVIVAIFVGFSIFQLGISREKQVQAEREKFNKQFIYKEILTWLDKLDEYIVGACLEKADMGENTPIREFDAPELLLPSDWKIKLTSIRGENETVYNTLYSLFLAFEKLAKSKDIYAFGEEYLIPFFFSISHYKLKGIRHLRDVVSYELYQAICFLEGIKPVDRVACYKNGNPLFIEKDGGAHYKILSNDGETLFDYDMKTEKGKKTFFDRFGRIRAQGNYEKGQLISGTVVEARCTETGEFEKVDLNLKYKEITQEKYRQNDSLMQHLCYANFSVKDSVYEIDGNIHYGECSFF